MSASFRFESKFESKVESEVKKDTHIRTKLNGNENESENKNESGGTCEGGAKRPRVGCFTRFVFVFVLIYVSFKLRKKKVFFCFRLFYTQFEITPNSLSSARDSS